MRKAKQSQRNRFGTGALLLCLVIFSLTTALSDALVKMEGPNELRVEDDKSSPFVCTYRPGGISHPPVAVNFTWTGQCTKVEGNICRVHPSPYTPSPLRLTCTAHLPEDLTETASRNISVTYSGEALIRWFSINGHGDNVYLAPESPDGSLRLECGGWGDPLPKVTVFKLPHAGDGPEDRLTPVFSQHDSRTLAISRYLAHKPKGCRDGDRPTETFRCEVENALRKQSKTLTVQLLCPGDGKEAGMAAGRSQGAGKQESNGIRLTVLAYFSIAAGVAALLQTVVIAALRVASFARNGRKREKSIQSSARRQKVFNLILENESAPNSGEIEVDTLMPYEEEAAKESPHGSGERRGQAHRESSEESLSDSEGEEAGDIPSPRGKRAES